MKVDREVFQRERATNASFDVATLFKTTKRKGEIGLEIEVEGNKMPQGPDSPWGEQDSHLIPKQWVYHHDGSLRGEMNAEYVLRKPLLFSQVPKAVDDLWKMFDDYGTKLDVSNRTSVHVHLNAQSFYLNRLCSFFALYFSVEEILTAWCGEHRVGNLFCLQARDAHRIVSQIKMLLKIGTKVSIPKHFHYSGLNIHALVKHGSLEIRSLRGATDKETVLQWVRVLQRIYELSDTFADPRDICSDFSGAGCTAFVNRVLGDEAETILNNCGLSYHEIQTACLNGIRIAQDLCYCRNWSEYEKIDTSNKAPFSDGSFLLNTYETVPGAPDATLFSPIWSPASLPQPNTEYPEDF